jgi:two-component system sensor kinase FixL
MSAPIDDARGTPPDSPPGGDLERSLHAAEGRWRSVIDSAVDGIIVIDERGTIESFNPAAQRMFGYAGEQAVGKNISLLMPEPYRAEHDRYIARHLATGERRIIGIGREVTGMRRDGTTFPVHISVGEFEIDGRKHFTGILHDLSRRSNLEDRLREATSLARLGEMAAVLAHEVKNPLAAVRGAIQVIGHRLPGESPDRSIITEILARLDALNALLKDLLLFARPPQPRFVPIPLRTLLEAVAELLKQDPAMADLDVSVAGDAAALAGDSDLLTIVFQNLFINAAQAMHGRGRLDVVIAAHDGWHQVQVTDSGPGIPLQMRDRLFRAFQTTKARGTGLGLSTAKRLVDLHGGSIEIESPAAGGTRVIVRLPSTRP